MGWLWFSTFKINALFYKKNIFAEKFYVKLNAQGYWYTLFISLLQPSPNLTNFVTKNANTIIQVILVDTEILCNKNDYFDNETIILIEVFIKYTNFFLFEICKKTASQYVLT